MDQVLLYIILALTLAGQLPFFSAPSGCSGKRWVTTCSQVERWSARGRVAEAAEGQGRAPTAAVLRVVGDWVSEVLQMYADLMRTPSERPALNDRRIAVSVVPDQLKLSGGGLRTAGAA